METTKDKTNETFKMVGSWETQSNHLKGEFSTLSDSDLKFETGKENELIARLGTKLNKSRDEIIHILETGQPETGQQSEKIRVAPEAQHGL